MIYRNLIRPLSTLSLALFALILTGCGGAASDDTPTSNKPNPVSAAASSISQIAAESSSLASSTTSLPTTSPSSSATFSSKAISSTYIRASRASTSAGSEPEDFPDEIIIPEKPRDTTDYPPTQPTDAKVVSASATEIGITWSASTDDIGIASYEIHRNGIYIGNSTAQKLSYQDKGLAANTTYIYTVRAVDTIGHRSAFSSPLTAKTLTASSSSSVKTSSSIASSKISTSSLSSKSASSQSSKSASSKSSVSGVFVVDWPIPIRRENGDYLELHEIGGYELRHKLVGSDAYTSLKISNTITSYTFDSTLITADSVEVAAFDIDGRYSRFINLLPK